MKFRVCYEANRRNSKRHFKEWLTADSIDDAILKFKNEYTWTAERNRYRYTLNTSTYVVISSI